MTVLKPSPVSTRRLSYDRAANLLVAEISDFGRGFSFGRVYDDACDEGLTLVSHCTGREVVCAVEHIERDRENDLLYWDLAPAKTSERGLIKVRIYND